MATKLERLDEGWNFAEGTAQSEAPKPPAHPSPVFRPVICVVSSISRLRPEELIEFSTPNLAMSNSDMAVASNAWFLEMSSTASERLSGIRKVPPEGQFDTPTPIITKHPDSVSETKPRSLWQRLRNR